MRYLVFLTNVFMLLSFLSCQVKEQASSGGLISGHTPTTNGFTLATPASKTFVSSEILSLQVTFPFPVIVTGTPRLQLTVGATTQYANYISGDGTTTLLFQYTFVGTDNDSDGITVVELGLNGGTLTFDNKGTITNCDVTSVTTTTFAGVKVDNSGPVISSFNLTNPIGFYNKDDVLTFNLTYNETVYVTGTPRISVTFTTGGAVYATYAGGSGSSSLSFTITIGQTMADTNGYNAITSPIDLNTGTIKDNVGNDASLNIAGFTPAVLSYSDDVKFDGRLPYVVSVTNPPNGTYISAQNLDFSFEFDRAVNLTGSPYIAVTIGSNVRQATYLSGTGTNTIIFRYTTVPGDVDSDGIEVATTITQNGGTINGAAAPTNSYFFVAANNAFALLPTNGIIINSIQPQPISIARNTDITNALWGTALDNIWIIDQELLISVSFNTNMYVGQTGGTPRIPLTIGVSTQYATYLSGGNGQTTLIFRYVVQENDLDTDGTIVLGNIDLNGGTITDGEGTNSFLVIPSPNLTNTRIDGVRPTVLSVGKPNDGTYSTVAGNNHLNFTFTVNWSEAVNYSTASVIVPLTIGATNVNATLGSGNNTASVIHRPASLAGLTDTDGIEVSSPLTGTATVRDQAGNAATVLTFPLPVTTGILVDTTMPAVANVTTPTPGTYTTGNDLNFVVTFTEVVNVQNAGGYPRIALVLDTGTRYATYVSGTGSDTLTFRYTVAAGDSDLNGITNPTVISIANAPTAYIRDLGWNGNTTTGYAITTDLTGVVVDALAPTVASRTFPANGTYQDGDVLQFTITYSEIVNVDETGGTPSIQVAAQTGALSFEYSAGTGTTTLTFSYTVTANDFDFDGLSNSITTIALNGGTIRDAALNDASLTFTAVNLSGVYLAYPDTVVWTTSSFVNRSAIAGINLSSGGAVTTEACGTSTCRTFDGDDSLSISAAMNSVETVFIVFKTPAALGNQNLFETDISLVDDGTAFDLNTANATLNLNGAGFSGVNHNTNMPTASTYILQTDFIATQNYAAGTIIATDFMGAIGEVIVVSGTLTAGQKAEILTYLNAKY